jgi:hypothetical protein
MPWAKNTIKRWNKKENAKLYKLIEEGKVDPHNRKKEYIALVHNDFFSEFTLNNFQRLFRKKGLNFELNERLSGQRSEKEEKKGM